LKNRKIENKLKKQKDRCAKELSEGITYTSAVVTTHHDDIQEIATAVSALVVQSMIECLYQKVFCDIETTSLQREADII